MTGGNIWAERFHDVIKYGKGAMLVVLFAGAVTNGHKEYIAENPRKFVWDSFAVGGLSALGFVAIAAMRGRMDQWVQLAMISFLVFFFYNVIREVSGFNAIADPEKLSKREQKEASALKVPVGVLFVVTILVLSFMAFKARVLLGPDSVIVPAQTIGGKIANFFQAYHPSGRLAFEAFIFGASTAIAEVIVAKNHGETLDGQIFAGGSNFLLFFYFHLLLQYGGFYSHVFAPAPPCIY